MKIRYGFVSNSSSSSFTCLVCGSTESGMDACASDFDFVECDKILGYHYDTFGYIEINKGQAIKKFFDKGKDLMLLNIGDGIEL